MPVLMQGERNRARGAKRRSRAGRALPITPASGATARETVGSIVKSFAELDDLAAGAEVEVITRNLARMHSRPQSRFLMDDWRQWD